MDVFIPPHLSVSGGVVQQLAERASGPIPRPVDFAYIWGDAPAEKASTATKPTAATLA